VQVVEASAEAEAARPFSEAADDAQAAPLARAYAATQAAGRAYDAA
jgi:hypothetical protein